MPEEINRVLTDPISDLPVRHEPGRGRICIREGLSSGERIHFVGNVMIDTLLGHRKLARKSDVLKRLGLGRRFAVATLHRPSNVDSAWRLEGILTALARIARTVDIVLPLHPRTSARIETVRVEGASFRAGRARGASWRSRPWVTSISSISCPTPPSF